MNKIEKSLLFLSVTILLAVFVDMARNKGQDPAQEQGRVIDLKKKRDIRTQVKEAISKQKKLAPRGRRPSSERKLRSVHIQKDPKAVFAPFVRQFKHKNKERLKDMYYEEVKDNPDNIDIHNQSYLFLSEVVAVPEDSYPRHGDPLNILDRKLGLIFRNCM